MAEWKYRMPDVGEGIVEVEVIGWTVGVGDVVEVDQPVADVMTDKANVEITSPVAGVVASLGASEGEMLRVGDTLLVLQTGDQPEALASKDEPAPPEEPPAPTEPPRAASSAPAEDADATGVPARTQTPPPVTPKPAAARPELNNPSGKPLASPAVRRRAREAGVALDEVGHKDALGRVTHQALDAHVAGLNRLAIGGLRQVRTGTKKIPLRGLRRITARRMQESKQRIPHFSYVESLDLTELESLRQHLNAHRSEQQSKLTLLPFLMLAMVRALGRFPECNAHFDEENEEITRFDGVHIGMATQTPDGLKVPVLRHVEVMDIWHCAAEIARLAEQARDNSIARADLSGSTITLTSLGPLGGIASTPVINPPEVSIIGVNRAEERVVVRDGQMVIRYCMNLSASFDHRIVDGHTAASMIQAIRQLLEQPATLFI